MTVESTFAAIRKEGPLVHAITNYVAMDLSANALLAVGASPAMIHAEEEAAEFAGLASALLVNIGTLSSPWVRGMEAATQTAKTRQIPTILDPVGAGATQFRKQTCMKLLDSCDVIRGNASEVLALAEGAASGKGVDSTDSAEAVFEAARGLARERKVLVAMTGEVDVVTDGDRSARIRGGHPWMTRVTATGCALSAVVAAACAVAPDRYEGALAALAAFKDAGERAARESKGPGSFRVALLDALGSEPAELSSRIEVL